MADKRWALTLLAIGLTPLIILVVFVIAPSLARGDLNPLIQVALGIVIIGFAGAINFLRLILARSQGALIQRINGGLRISALFVIAIVVALVAVTGVIITLREAAH